MKVRDPLRQASRTTVDPLALLVPFPAQSVHAQEVTVPGLDHMLFGIIAEQRAKVHKVCSLPDPVHDCCIGQTEDSNVIKACQTYRSSPNVILSHEATKENGTDRSTNGTGSGQQSSLDIQIRLLIRGERNNEYSRRARVMIRMAPSSATKTSDKTRAKYSRLSHRVAFVSACTRRGMKLLEDSYRKRRPTNGTRAITSTRKQTEYQSNSKSRVST